MQTAGTDSQSEAFLLLLAQQEKIRANKVPGVRIVLVILSARAMVFDTESLKQKILLSYPETAVFFMTTSGKPIGLAPPKQVDLLIDFTGPGQRQGLFFAKKLRTMARVATGRNAGFFRSRIYDRVFDEKTKTVSGVGTKVLDPLERERQIQREVLALAGIALAQMGDTPPDRGKTIALELPALQRL